jgi:chromosome segregation ATPase
MSLNVSPIVEPEGSESALDTSVPVSAPEVTTSVFMGSKPMLKNWKMFGQAPQDMPKPEEDAEVEAEAEVTTDLMADPIIPRNFSDRSIRAARPATPYWLQIGQALAVFVTVAWVTYAVIYILALPNSIKTITSSPLTLGGILASVLAPIAMLWLCLATWQRRSDAHIYAQALREELRGLFYPDADQSNLISDDIRDLMRQATEMSAASRGSVKAIQRARTGLRAEIRDFAGVSQKAEFHIDRLTDALSKRAEELLSLTEVIESQTENISTKAQRGIGMWENASAEISELGDEIDQMFDKGAEKIQVASDAALERVKTIETSMTNAVDELSSSIDGVTTQIDASRNSMDDQANRLASVSDAINSGAERLETSLTDAEHIYGAVEGMMNIMSESLNKVEGTAEHFFEKTNAIEQKLESRADALKESADKLLSSTDDLQNIGDLATNKLGEALALALSGAETITTAVRRSKDMMDLAVVDASTQIERTSKVADEKLEALMEQARTNRDQLNKIIAEIEEKQSQLSATTQKMDESRIELSAVVDKATTSLDAATTNMVTQSDKPLKLIQSSIAQLEEHTQEMESKLAARTVEVQQETGKLKSLVSGIDETVQESVEKLTSVTTLLTEQSEAIHENVATQRQSLDGFVQDMSIKASAIASSLAERRSNIEQSISSTEEKISSLGTSFFDKGDALVEKVNFVSEKITSYEDSLNASIVSVNAKYGEVSEKVSGQIKYMTELSEFISPEADRILSKVETLHASYDDLKDKCFAVADESSAALMGFSEKLESRIIRLGTETTETSKILLGVTSDMTETLSNIKQHAEEAHDSIAQIQSGMKGRVDDLHLISDRVQMKVEMMQNNLGTYAKDLNDVLHLTMADLEMATEKFGQTTSILDEKTDGVTSRIIDATRQYVEEGHRMALLSEQTVHKAARIVAVIQQESDKLVNTSKASLMELQKSGDTLSVRTKEIEEYLKASTHHTRTYGDSLREQASLIANHSSDIVDKISAVTVKLSLKANEVKQVNNHIIEEIENAGARLEEATNVLGRVARITIEAVDDAVTGFAEHGNVLRNTVNNLTTQMQNVKEVQTRTERETFLSSAKFVIESLYSLAVDVSRHLEGELDVRVLRTYQKGDVSAYVRHLVELAPRMPIDKSQRKFIEDGEFRTYVLRFIRQYEELLEQAQANDYGDLLSSVFSTSDIGKLYKVLCEIAGRSSKEH